MTEHPNVQRVRDLFAARAADVATIERLLAPDAVWHFPGAAAASPVAPRPRRAVRLPARRPGRDRRRSAST
jgi:ketosteroid isomerase-like protein